MVLLQLLMGLASKQPPPQIINLWIHFYPVQSVVEFSRDQSAVNWPSGNLRGGERREGLICANVTAFTLHFLLIPLPSPSFYRPHIIRQEGGLGSGLSANLLLDSALSPSSLPTLLRHGRVDYALGRSLSICVFEIYPPILLIDGKLSV
ncbi:hypothetical protein ACTXT7_008286 [Hymenolepis weldensis]